MLVLHDGDVYMDVANEGQQGLFVDHKVWEQILELISSQQSTDKVPEFPKRFLERFLQ